MEVLEQSQVISAAPSSGRWLLTLLGVFCLGASTLASAGARESPVQLLGAGEDDQSIASVADEVGSPLVAADTSDPSVPVPFLEGQFARFAQHGDPMAFRRGIGDDPTLYRHYQGMARVNGSDGTPYMMLTRSGNSTDASPCRVLTLWLPPYACDEYPGELVTVRLGSRDTDGERLRSNLLARGTPMEETSPPSADVIVSSIHFDGEEHNGTVWPQYMHLGGVQAVGDVLVVPLESHCASGWGPVIVEDTPSGDWLVNGCLGAQDRGGIALVDVSDPETPRLLLYEDLTEQSSTLTAVGVAGVTYVSPDEHPTNGDRYLFAMTWGDSSELRFAWSDTNDLATTSEITLEPTLDWDETQLVGDQETWREWQTLNFVRDPDPVEGSSGLYLIGGGHTGSGDDWIGLFNVDPDSAPGDGLIEYKNQKHLQLNDPDMGTLAAASGVYVSPTGQLILYTGPHDNDRFDGTVEMGEFRNIFVAEPGTPAIETICPYVELYADEVGWYDTSPDRSLMLDFKDRHLEDWLDLNAEFGGGPFGDGEADSLIWYLMPGQRLGLYEDAQLMGVAVTIQGTGSHGFIPSLDDHPSNFGDEIESVYMSGIADPGGPYSGTVGSVVEFATANRCYPDDSPLSVFAWSVDSPDVCTLSDPWARQPSLTCSKTGTFNVQLTVIAGVFDVVSASTTVTITDEARPPPPPLPPPPDGDGDGSGDHIEPCPTPGTTSPFDDMATASVSHRDDITCVYELGVTTGTSPTTYSPLDNVTRQQMASFLARLYRAITGTDAAIVPVPFTDMDTASVSHRDDISRIYGLGVTTGTSPTTYSPLDNVTRQQMASFLARLYASATGTTAPVVAVPFDDMNTGSPTHWDDIARIYGLDITTGTSPTTYSPLDNVTRQQMASFLARLYRAA